MTNNENKEIELNGADIFSDWNTLIESPQQTQKQVDDLGLDLGNLMTDSGETNWLEKFHKTNLSGMDLIALKLIPTFTHDFIKERGQLKIQTRIFLLDLATTHQNDLRVAGLSEDQIQGLANGLLPINWTVHLKYPVAYGGTIIANNLVLIPEHPFHEELHHFINQQTISDAGIITPATLYVPCPKTPVYIPFGTSEMADKVIHFETVGAIK